MLRLLVIVGLFLICTAVVVGQKGTAEPDYYPQNYSGDTWSGVVTAVNEDTREFTLTYKKKDKEESFIGVLPKGYQQQVANGSYREIQLSDLMGMTIRAYYMTKTKKLRDQKVKYNEVFKIKIVALKKP